MMGARTTNMPRWVARAAMPLIFVVVLHGGGLRVSNAYAFWWSTWWNDVMTTINGVIETANYYLDTIAYYYTKYQAIRSGDILYENEQIREMMETYKGARELWERFQEYDEELTSAGETRQKYRLYVYQDDDFFRVSVMLTDGPVRGEEYIADFDHDEASSALEGLVGSMAMSVWQDVEYGLKYLDLPTEAFNDTGSADEDFVKAPMRRDMMTRQMIVRGMVAAAESAREGGAMAEQANEIVGKWHCERDGWGDWDSDCYELKNAGERDEGIFDMLAAQTRLDVDRNRLLQQMLNLQTMEMINEHGERMANLNEAYQQSEQVLALMDYAIDGGDYEMFGYEGPGTGDGARGGSR